MAIPNSTITNHHSGSVYEDIAMGMRSQDFTFLAEVLNGLYSNVIAAPVREYSTNARDSHVEAGVTRPVEITLPTEGSLEFVVQDFGLGMSIDDLRETYSMYGASSKRDTNAVAGQLGLGSKSGLSYADGFTVVAVKDHEKVSVFVTKDERGLGVIKVLTPPAATDEGNGVKITIPVDRHDVDEFRSEAINLFQFWAPGTVLIDGEVPETPEWVAAALSLDDDTLLVRKDECGSSYVVMGDVPYPVPDVTVGRSSYRFIARLNIGDVDFVPSREDVKYTAWTKETLSDLHDFINQRFRRCLSEALEGCTSAWEETLLRVAWKGSNTNLRASSDYKIWTFNPAVRWGRKSQAHLGYAVANLTSSKTVVITGFTAKNISTTARDRMIEFAGRDSAFVVVPSGVPTAMLNGRPNTYVWSDIVGVTTKPKAQRGPQGPKIETVYSIHGRPGMTAKQLAAVTGKVVFLNSGERCTHGGLGDDVTIVGLYSSAQLPRLQRFVPNIEPYQAEVERQRIAARDAVTQADRDIVRAKGLAGTFAEMDPNLIDDPELASLIRASKTPDTTAMVNARRFGIEIEAKPLPKFKIRYPLVGGTYYGLGDEAVKAERIFYINAKYAAAQAAKVAPVAVAS